VRDPIAETVLHGQPVKLSSGSIRRRIRRTTGLSLALVKQSNALTMRRSSWRAASRLLNDVAALLLLQSLEVPDKVVADALVLFQTGSRNVVDATYFCIALIRSEKLSPERVGHTAAKLSQVRRPIKSASHDCRRSFCISKLIARSCAKCGPEMRVFDGTIERDVGGIDDSAQVSSNGLLTKTVTGPNP
jgi:hypothetical protein